jgi:hypothetical protein
MQCSNGMRRRIESDTQVCSKETNSMPAITQKLEQLKSLLSEGLITQAQYQKASQQVLNQLVQ